MFLDSITMDAEALRKARTLTQAEVDRRNTIHDLEDFTPYERLGIDIEGSPRHLTDPELS